MVASVTYISRGIPSDIIFETFFPYKAETIEAGRVSLFLFRDTFRKYTTSVDQTTETKFVIRQIFEGSKMDLFPPFSS